MFATLVIAFGGCVYAAAIGALCAVIVVGGVVLLKARR
jgi:hypothetical protein